MAVLIALYYLGLGCWFYQDDFGWLAVRRDIHGWGDVPAAIFGPKAHGNMRPWSETGFFTLFSAVFGLNAVAFHVWVFLTVIAGMLLLGEIARRLAHSDAAMFWAPALWVVNYGLAPVMCWNSVYNQALCAFFLLLAFYFLLRHTETGEPRFWKAQWIAFLLGFGALETMVVYPAVASVFVAWRAPKLLKKTLWLFAASAAYIAVHWWFTPAAAEGAYALHFDFAMAGTLWRYWKMALGGAPAVVLTPAAALFVAGALRRRAWVRLLGPAWFLLTLAPFLPLRDHVMDYYLAVPAIGLGMMGAWAAAARGPWKIAAFVPVALYAGFSAPAAHAVSRWHYERSRAVEDLVLGVAEAHRAAPDKTILLTGVGTDVFLAGMVDVPFRLLEIPRVYLAPRAEARIQAPADLLRKFVLPDALALAECEAGRAVVYDAGGPVLRNITRRWSDATPLSRETPRFINAGDEIFARYLGSGWAAARDGYRAVEGSATLRIGGPRGAGETLVAGLFDSEPPRLRADGLELPLEGATRHADRLDCRYRMPAALAGKRELEILIDAGGRRPVLGYVELQ